MIEHYTIYHLLMYTYSVLVKYHDTGITTSIIFIFINLTLLNEGIIFRFVFFILNVT